jgi:hypothetical protein
MMVGARMVGIVDAAIVALLVLPPGTVVAQEQEQQEPGLTVSPTEGGVDTVVTATPEGGDEPCAIGSVTFGGQAVAVTGSGGSVTFRVPDVPDDVYQVGATCTDGTQTSSASFRVETGTTTSATVPSTSGTRPSTTVTEPPTTEPGETTTTQQGTGTTVPRPPETIEECEEQASTSDTRLVYEPEREMVVGDSYDVRAALSLDDLPPDVTFESPTTIVEVPGARCTIAAQLTGADFEITPDEPVAQSFVGTRVLLWEWDVVPTRVSDDLELDLTIQATVFEGGRTIPGQALLRKTTIDVNAEPRSLPRRLTDWTRDVFGHPLVPVVIVPAAGAGYVWLRRWLAARQPPRDTPQPGGGAAGG